MIPNALPPGTEQLNAVKGVTRAMEDYSYQVMDAQTANNRIGPGSKKTNNAFAAPSAFWRKRVARRSSRFRRRANFILRRARQRRE